MQLAYEYMLCGCDLACKAGSTYFVGHFVMSRFCLAVASSGVDADAVFLWVACAEVRGHECARCLAARQYQLSAARPLGCADVVQHRGIVLHHVVSVCSVGKCVLPVAACRQSVCVEVLVLTIDEGGDVGRIVWFVWSCFL